MKHHLRETRSDSIGTRPSIKSLGVPLSLDKHIGPNRLTAESWIASSLLFNQRGRPLVAGISRAQVHDSRMLIPVLNSVPSMSGRARRNVRRPYKLHANKAYASHAHRIWVHNNKGIAPRIVRYVIESHTRIG